MKQHVKDLISDGIEFRVKVNPAQSETLQNMFFEKGYKWSYDKAVIKFTGFEEIFIRPKDKEISANHKWSTEGPWSEIPEVKYQDILTPAPSLPFQVGDKVRAFGVDGEVKAVTAALGRPVLVNFYNDNADQTWFELDGRHLSWHKEPSLTLVDRPKKKIKKVFHLYSTKEGTLCDLLLDDKGNTPSGKHGDFVENMVKIPGTEVVLEVLADNFANSKVET